MRPLTGALKLVRPLVFFVLPIGKLIFFAHLICGAAAATGLALLVPPLIG